MDLDLELEAEADNAVEAEDTNHGDSGDIPTLEALASADEENEQTEPTAEAAACPPASDIDLSSHTQVTHDFNPGLL